jgi:tetratricopeptide (TPR) repeat protein
MAGTMSRLKQLIVEIHRRSLWQVMTIYLGASWAVLEASDQVIGRYLLPEWVYPTEILLLLVGLPLVLATAFVREERETVAETARGAGAAAKPRDTPTPSTVEPETDLAERERAAATPSAEAAGAGFLSRYLTLPVAVLAVVGALAIVGVASAFVVVRGAGRVTESSGTAGDAFEERAWLVVPEFEATLEDREVALAAREALTVDLQQSRYVNVYSREQLSPVLRRMGRPDTTRLDRAVALEVAEREGLAAVLAVTVSRLGGQYVFSARVVQPGSGEEIITARSVASEDRLLEGVEKLSHEIRRRLGEARDAIRQSEPLPKVTTSSLEALKLYARASEANGRYEFEQALEFATQAVRLDSTFAGAYRALAVYSSNLGHRAEAARYATRAYELRDGLTERERLSTEATYYSQAEWDYRHALQTYELILSRYPDEGSAANNLAAMAERLGERERAYQASLTTVELQPYSALAYGHVIANARWTGRWEVADSFIQVARELGFEQQAADWSLAQALGRRDWGRAEFLCDSLLTAASGAGRLASMRTRCGALDIARGRLQRGVERELAVAEFRVQRGEVFLYGPPVFYVVMADATRGRHDEARALFERVIAYADPESLAEPERFVARQTLQVFAYLLEMPDLAEQTRAAYPPFPDSTHPISHYGEWLAGAARALHDGEAERAVDLLRQLRALDLILGNWELLADIMFGLSFEQLGEADSAVAYLEQLTEPALLAGNAFARVQLPIIELRLARLEESRGNVDGAVRHYRNFLEIWAEPDPELSGDVEAARRALARLAGQESS